MRSVIPGVELTTAVSHLESVFAPLPVTSIKLWNFIPFDRRRVTAVFPPNQPSEGAPAFTTRYHRFRTVPAPWSEEEGWKGRAPHKAASDNTLDGNEHVPPGGVPFEQEKDTCPIPAELDVWVDCEGLEDFDTQCVVGMGLRARWAQIGTEEEKWWIFKLKDCELPRARARRREWCQCSITSQRLVERNGCQQASMLACGQRAGQLAKKSRAMRQYPNSGRLWSPCSGPIDPSTRVP